MFPCPAVGASVERGRRPAMSSIKDLDGFIAHLKSGKKVPPPPFPPPKLCAVFASLWQRYDDEAYIFIFPPFFLVIESGSLHQPIVSIGGFKYIERNFENAFKIYVFGLDCTCGTDGLRRQKGLLSIRYYQVPQTGSSVFQKIY